jgi:hypothetical protein
VTCASAASPASNDRCNAGSARLTSGASFYLLASITVALLAGSSAPTVLYPIDQDEWGFSSATLTLIFGIYALAPLGALLVAGRLSDHVGRHLVLLVATTIQALVMVQFSMAEGSLACSLRASSRARQPVPRLPPSEPASGPEQQTGAVANAVAPGLGTALGAIVSGLMVSYLPAPTHLVYLALSTVFTLQAVAVWLMPERVPHNEEPLHRSSRDFRYRSPFARPCLLRCRCSLPHGHSRVSMLLWHQCCCTARSAWILPLPIGQDVKNRAAFRPRCSRRARSRARWKTHCGVCNQTGRDRCRFLVGRLADASREIRRHQKDGPQPALLVNG